FGFVFRSPVAHAEISGLDLSEARAAPGVHMVLDHTAAQELGIDLRMGASLIENRDGSKGANPDRPFLASGRVRFVGEPVAFVVAETLTQARDAAELIGFDYSDLPVKVDVAPGGSTLHGEAPDNVVFD